MNPKMMQPDSSDMTGNTEEDTADLSPWESITSKLDSYIADPKLITPETLQELKQEIEDLKAGYEGEETEAGPQSEPAQPEGGEGKPSLVIAIGKARGKKE